MWERYSGHDSCAKADPCTSAERRQFVCTREWLTWQVLLSGCYHEIALYENFLYPPNVAAFQANFDAVRMFGRFGQQIFDNAFRQFAGALIFLQDNVNPLSGLDMTPNGSVHRIRRIQPTEHTERHGKLRFCDAARSSRYFYSFCSVPNVFSPQRRKGAKNSFFSVCFFFASSRLCGKKRACIKNMLGIEILSEYLSVSFRVFRGLSSLLVFLCFSSCLCAFVAYIYDCDSIDSRYSQRS